MPQGAKRPCGITLGNHDGVLSCYEGSQVCSQGLWSACGEGEVVNHPASGAANAPSNHAMALSAPAACQNNPCDPFCQNFNEVPDSGPIMPDAGKTYNWPIGSVGGLPGGLVNKGFIEPCRTGADCQFNSRCIEPKTGSTCDHSKCATGSGLGKSCDTCVGMILAPKRRLLQRGLRQELQPPPLQERQVPQGQLR